MGNHPSISKRLVWLSANEYGLELLREALKIPKLSVAAIVTLGESSKTVMYDGVPKEAWMSFNLPVYTVRDSTELESLMKKLKPDLVVMCGWRQKILDVVLAIPSGGVVGFHPTLLPEGRGPAPIINTILSGLKTSGVTMFYLSDVIDGGDIIGQEKFEIGPDDTAAIVYKKVTKAGKVLIRKYLPFLLRGTAPRVHQDENRATYFKPRILKDNEISLTDGLPEIYRKIRAFSKPYRGAFIKKGRKKLIIWEAELHEDI